MNLRLANGSTRNLPEESAAGRTTTKVSAYFEWLDFRQTKMRMGWRDRKDIHTL